MNNIKAFPFVLNDGSDEYCSGMELRDYFAAKAMQALLAWELAGYLNISKEAYLLADSMMEARNGE